jgi:hypothetical protein
MEVYGVVPREDVPGWDCMYEVEGMLVVRWRVEIVLTDGVDLDIGW